LLVAGAWLEQIHPGRLLWHTVISAPLVGVMILVAEPGLKTYGGLSGLATGVVVLLSLDQLRTSGTTRWLWTGGLVLVALKAAYDATHPVALFAHYDQPGLRTSSSAHAAGAIIAVFHYAALRLTKTIPPGPIAASRRQGSG
jgi:hypothetical protein